MGLDLDLSGRTVVVCGAGSSGAGLSNGEAAALAYARAGARVAVLDVRAEEAERVAREIVSTGGSALAVRADVTSEDDVEAAVALVAREYGAPHVLHNNVGVASLGSVLEVDRAGWDRALALNLTSVYLTCRHVLPLMLHERRGVITNVSSLASIRDTGYEYPSYASSKAGLNQLTVSLASTYADRGIRANALLPGLIETPLVTSQITGDAEALARRHASSPTGRMGRPEDVAHAAVFLASDLAAYVNGVCLPIDGGLAVRCL
jgi:NAD(P)-dependent dehydrogenase (short-subunit alcohol dehydrogenase family)